MILKLLACAGVLLIASGIWKPGRADAPGTCTYSTYSWNTLSRKATNFRQVRKPFSSLTTEEIDATTRCSVCEQDQVWISIKDAPRFRVCRHVAGEVRRALEQALAQGATIRTIEGYRVGMTRGEADTNGNRTGFSNHSFGVAVDINSEQNGLYGNCLRFGPHCRLLRGGPWSPDQAGSLREGGPVVQAFKVSGFKWGGEIAGRQKDFMHFSITGY